MRCHPLIDRFMDRGVPEVPTQPSDQTDYWSRRNLLGRVDLYIPAPPGRDRHQALLYHLATRNFFAFLCRRSVVGETLGAALVGLMTSMDEFRTPEVDNEHELEDYMDEEGYLDMRNQPVQALAIMHLAEAFRLRELYIDAFAHCVGMSDRLFSIPDYQVR